MKSNTVTKSSPWLTEQFTESQAASCMPQQAIWRGLLAGFSQLVSVFIEESQNFVFYFLHNKVAKKFKNYQRTYRKYWFEF